MAISYFTAVCGYKCGFQVIDMVTMIVISRHQSVRREPLLGTRAQRTIMNTIIATNLYMICKNG